MITPRENMIRVTVTLDPIDVELLDRLAVLEGLNRSAELRSLLGQLRPMVRQTVEAFEAAAAQRDKLTEAAAAATMSQLQALLPEAEKLQNAWLGALARWEGSVAQQQAEAGDYPDSDDLPEAPDPRPSNHGGHTPTPTPPEDD